LIVKIGLEAELIREYAAQYMVSQLMIDFPSRTIISLANVTS
jgi:hypothetical protein